MITVRERIGLAELIKGIVAYGGTELVDHFREVLPLDRRCHAFTNQGKTAFEQIVLAAGLERSRILVPAFFPDDFIGVFQKHGITPVFVDVDPHRYQLDLEAVTQEQLDGARAMIVLHTFGLPADGLRYRAFCDARKLVMIEDCARALGAAARGTPVGGFGHYALFSLPKCTPVREGGIVLSEAPMQPDLLKARIGLFGVLHALTLIRVPFTSVLEGPLYRLLADTAVYPREVGNYEARPARGLDPVGRNVLKAFMPRYADALRARRACALNLRRALAPCGFTFQADDGDHIFTALATEPPAGWDPDELNAFLESKGVKAATMWREPLGLTKLAERTWGAKPDSTPVAMQLARRLIQLPVNRMQTPKQTETIIAACKQFVSA